MSAKIQLALVFAQALDQAYSKMGAFATAHGEFNLTGISGILEIEQKNSWLIHSTFEFVPVGLQPFVPLLNVRIGID